jgi:K+-transporting ATPase ATPase C chain
MFTLLRNALVFLLLLTLVTGVIYPLAVTAVAQGLFAHTANGSVMERDGKALGSELIGQAFTNPKYFWPRPSATAPFTYNAAASGASNFGPDNPDLADAVKQRVAALRAADPGNTTAVPVDLVTTSASGLDPHISPAAAQYQAHRVAKLRGIGEEKIAVLIAAATEGRQLGILGEPRVNVLRLNLALDQAAPAPTAR